MSGNTSLVDPAGEIYLGLAEGGNDDIPDAYIKIAID